MAPYGSAVAARTLVVLVDSDTDNRRAVQLRLRAGRFEVRAYASGSTMLADAAAASPDCLVVRDRMATCDGFAVLSQMRCRGWHGSAILMTDAPGVDLDAAAAHAGFRAVVDRPSVDDVLLHAVEAATQVSLVPPQHP